MAALRKVAYSLLEGNPLARPVPAVRARFRIRAERHFIYFKVARGEIVIMRFVHERMEAPGNLD